MRAAIAIVACLAAVNANAQVSLKRGVFADQRVRCDAGHGYNYYKYDGQYIIFGAPPVSEKLRRIVGSKYIGEYRSYNGKFVQDRITVQDATHFVWLVGGRTFHIRFCPNSALPKEWREPGNSNGG